MDVGRAPIDLALKPDGGEIFVANFLSDSVSEIYNSTDEVGDTYMIGAGPVSGLVSRDNALLYRIISGRDVNEAPTCDHTGDPDANFPRALPRTRLHPEPHSLWERRAGDGR